MKTTGKDRLASLDLARGLAISLMILSHGVVGVYPFEKLEDWQLVPVHLITKFSSSLFFTVFGISLAWFFIPYVNDPTFKARARRLFFRGLEILIWYKILTFVQMFQIYERKDIIDTLLLKKSTDFTEVLGFYGIFLLWFPFAARTWSRLPLWGQPFLALAIGLMGAYLTLNFDFGGMTALKAILVENPGFYTFGQMQRGGMVLFGMFLGTLTREKWEGNGTSLAKVMLIIGGLLWCYFFYTSFDDLYQGLMRIAGNGGKHPPDLPFLAFSLGGAYLILAACLTQKKIPWILKPFTWLGERPLQAFIFHIFLIFVVYRYLLDLRHQTSYEDTLHYTLLLIGLTMSWCLGLKIKGKMVEDPR